MRAMKLDISLLPDPETRLIQAYFRLYAHEPDFHWKIAEAAPFDAIIVDADSPESPRLQAGCERVIRLGNEVTGEYALQRPLRSDTLVELLRSLQSPTQSATVTAITPVVPAPVVPVIAPEVASERAEAQAPVASLSTIPSEYFRLTTLPPVALLQRNPQRQHAASLLLRAPMCLQEIAQATRWQLSEAQTFVGLLKNTGLLEVSEGPRRPAEQGQDHASSADADSSLSFGQAISSLRRKLGL